MKKEIKFTISDSLHTELQGIVEKKKLMKTKFLNNLLAILLLNKIFKMIGIL
jgi:hypothetical protein